MKKKFQSFKEWTTENRDYLAFGAALTAITAAVVVTIVVVTKGERYPWGSAYESIINNPVTEDVNDIKQMLVDGVERAVRVYPQGNKTNFNWFVTPAD